MKILKWTSVSFMLLFILSACENKEPNASVSLADTMLVDSFDVNCKTSFERKIVEDSLVILDDSLFTDIKLNFIEISKDDFQGFKKSYKTSCVIDSGGFISGSGLHIVHDCNEICDTYLAEDSTNRKLLLPTDYDSGVMSILLSPSCQKMIVCSSYDGPDFGEYYNYRCGFGVFNVIASQGLKGIVPSLDFNTKDWSIYDLTWIDDKTVALKTYKGRNLDILNAIQFKYYKTILRK
jgi:hypothetical protein